MWRGCGGGGGGGGGCGGGCGRKKRSILEEQIKTHETAVCPQSEWRTVMLENMLEDVNSAQHSIQGSMFRQYEGGKFFVSCTENTKIRLFHLFQTEKPSAVTEMKKCGV
uniref:Uncharacterized protein n=1 Tax=Ditylenchus dipsaci TaxID=166011 RepID=A0A915D072_9BILA